MKGGLDPLGRSFRVAVTHRFRLHLFARARSGAHAEIAREGRTTRYQVERAFRLGA